MSIYSHENGVQDDSAGFRSRLDPLFLLILAIFVIGYLTSPYFLTPLNLENLMRNGSVLGLLSLGMTMVLLTGRIDLSVAAIMVNSVIVGVVVSVHLGDAFDQRWLVRGNQFVGPELLVIGISLCTGAVLGAINGLGNAYFRIASFIMTLVMLTALRGWNFILTNGHPYYLKGDVFSFFGDRSLLGVPTGFIIFAAATLGMLYFVRRTIHGSRLYAIGGNETASIFTGIKTSRYVVMAFVISGICSALAGVLLTSRLKSVDAPLGAGYELTAIAIAVIGGVALSGGIGSPWRTLLASFAFAAGLNLLSIWGVGTWYQNLAIGVVLIGAIGIARLRQRQ